MEGSHQADRPLTRAALVVGLSKNNSMRGSSGSDSSGRPMIAVESQGQVRPAGVVASILIVADVLL